MSELFTIGHSNYDIAHFIYLLQLYHIDYLLDVRSTPYSKYVEQFNREYLASALGRINIQYFFMGGFFGARLHNPALYDDGCLNFEKVRETPKFQKGMENVLLGFRQKHRIVLMCSEKHPFDCHRAILIARAFALKNIFAKHIMPDGNIFLQQELDSFLLQKYFPNRNQLTLFTEDFEMDEYYYLNKAYKLRNKEIGHHI